MKSSLLPVVAVSLLVSAGGAWAQQGDPLVVRKPTPTVTVGRDGNAPGAEQTINLTDLLATWAKLAGKRVILDSTAQGTLPFLSAPEATPEQRVATIEKTLFINGFALYDASEDTVAVLGPGKPTRGYGLPVYSKPEEMPTGERVFTYLVRLKHREPKEVAATLMQYVPPSNSNAFVADPGSRSLLVTGQTAVVRQALKLMELIDVPAAEVGGPAQPGNGPRPVKPEGP